jgi:septum formation protein
MRQIVLASSSPRRRELLTGLGIHFRVVPSNIDETMNPRLGPHAQAERLAKAKAAEVAKRFVGRDILVISADTIVFCQGEQMGKPTSHEDAERMLRKQSGKKEEVITGFTILDCKTEKFVTKSVSTFLWMRKLSDREITAYLSRERVFDKAGAYAIQGVGQLLFEKIEGDYTNVLGLPVTPLAKELRKFNLVLL